MHISLEQIELLESIKNKSIQSTSSTKNLESTDINYLLEKGLISGTKTTNGYSNLSITPAGSQHLALLESHIEKIFKPDLMLVNMPRYLKIPFAILIIFGALMTLVALAHNLGFNT